MTDGRAVSTTALAAGRLLVGNAIVEATGAVEYATHVIVSAIDGGKHVVLLNAEVDGTVGSELARRADAAGVVLTGCDGDQPGV